MKNKKLFFKKPNLNSSGMALAATLMISFMVGLASIAIVRNIESQNKNKSISDLSTTAKSLKENLVLALKSDTSWQKTKSDPKNLELINTFSPGSTKSLKMNIYKSATDLLIPRDADTAGFTFNGEPCNSFNYEHGNNECPFKYIVTLRNVTSNGAEKIPTLFAELKFKAADNKFILNTQTNDYSFTFTPSVDTVKSQNFCESIGATFNSSSNSCSQQMTKQTNSCPAGTTFGGSTNDQNYCKPVSITPVVCPAGQYAAGFDKNHKLECKTL